MDSSSRTETDSTTTCTQQHTHTHVHALAESGRAVRGRVARAKRLLERRRRRGWTHARSRNFVDCSLAYLLPPSVRQSRSASDVSLRLPQEPRSPGGRDAEPTRIARHQVPHAARRTHGHAQHHTAALRSVRMTITLLLKTRIPLWGRHFDAYRTIRPARRCCAPADADTTPHHCSVVRLLFIFLFLLLLLLVLLVSSALHQAQQVQGAAPVRRCHDAAAAHIQRCVRGHHHVSRHTAHRSVRRSARRIAHRSTAKAQSQLVCFFFLLLCVRILTYFFFFPFFLSLLAPLSRPSLLVSPSRKQGFPFRLSHEDFFKRFKCILPKKTWPNHKAACIELIGAMGQDTTLVQMGVTKVATTGRSQRTRARPHVHSPRPLLWIALTLAHIQHLSRVCLSFRPFFFLILSTAGALPRRRTQEHGAQAKRQCDNLGNKLSRRPVRCNALRCGGESMDQQPAMSTAGLTLFLSLFDFFFLMTRSLWRRP